MALSLTEIQSITDNIWLPGSYPQWGKGNIMLFKFLEKREKKGSREYAQVVLEYAKAWGGPMGAATIFNTARKAVLNAARYPWGYFWSGATIDINDMTQVSGGDGEIDIVFAKLDNMQRSLKADSSVRYSPRRLVKTMTFSPAASISSMISRALSTLLKP